MKLYSWRLSHKKAEVNIQNSQMLIQPFHDLEVISEFCLNVKGMHCLSPNGYEMTAESK